MQLQASVEPAGKVMSDGVALNELHLTGGGATHGDPGVMQSFTPVLGPSTSTQEMPP